MSRKVLKPVQKSSWVVDVSNLYVYNVEIYVFWSFLKLLVYYLDY